MRGDAGGDVEVVFETGGSDELELVIELAAEVAGFEDELLVEDVLVDAEVVNAGTLGGDGWMLKVELPVCWRRVERLVSCAVRDGSCVPVARLA